MGAMFHVGFYYNVQAHTVVYRFDHYFKMMSSSVSSNCKFMCNVQEMRSPFKQGYCFSQNYSSGASKLWYSLLIFSEYLKTGTFRFADILFMILHSSDLNQETK